MAEEIKIKRKRRKRQKWSEGDYFLVKLLDGDYVIGQIQKYAYRQMGSVAALYFNIKVKSKEEALLKIETLTDKDVIVAQFTLTDSLDWIDVGTWEIIKNGEVKYLWKFFTEYQFTATRIPIYGSGIIDDLLNAYYGLYPWDCYADKEYFDKMLVSKDKKPLNLKYKVSFKPLPNNQWELISD